MIDDHELESLAALYIWEKNREADKVAAESDFQSSGPAEHAERMRKATRAEESVLAAFMAWIKKRRKG